VLTDTALKNLRPKARAYKSTDRDGMYVYVSTGGAISFRYDYRFNGRRETLTLGRYGSAGLTLAQARERLIEVKKAIADGVSPAVEKQRAKRRLKEAHDFAQVAQGWMDRAPMADSTRDMRRAIFNRDILPKWKNRLLSEITPDDLRAHCKAIVDRGAPATAIHVRDIVKQIYGWAILHGEKIDNPADDVGPASIATFRPRDRSLTPAEIRIMLMLLGEVATLPTIRLGLKFILLSMVRKSELQDGVWTEVDFDNAVWSIPAARMKRSRPHNVYLSTQMLDILVALKTCAGNSKYILPSRYDADAPMSRATFNRVTSAIAERAGKGTPSGLFAAGWRCSCSAFSPISSSARPCRTDPRSRQAVLCRRGATGACPRTLMARSGSTSCIATCRRFLIPQATTFQRKSPMCCPPEANPSSDKTVSPACGLRGRRAVSEPEAGACPCGPRRGGSSLKGWRP